MSMFKGKITINGTICEGEFHNNIFKKGKLTFPNGQIQEGEFEEQLIKGKTIFTDGTICEGEFYKGLLQRGKATFISGHVWEGVFDKEKLIKGTKSFQIDTYRKRINIKFI